MEMPCIQEELTSLAVRGKAPKPAKANTFLFINNTSSINPREVRGKQGGNPDVRSHVGRRSRREKKEQERLQRETDERSGYVALAPRTSSNSEEDILLEQIPTPVRYPKSSKLCSLSLKSHTPDYESSIDTSIYDIPELRSLQNSDERRRRTSSIEAFGGGRLDPFHSSVNASANLLTHELVDIGEFRTSPDSKNTNFKLSMLQASTTIHLRSICTSRLVFTWSWLLYLFQHLSICRLYSPEPSTKWHPGHRSNNSALSQRYGN